MLLTVLSPNSALCNTFTLVSFFKGGEKKEQILMPVTVTFVSTTEH